MHPKIDAEIKKFEALQDKYADIGARDSDAEAVFQMLITRAVTKEPVDFSEGIDWDLLYDDEEDDESTGAMFDQACTEMNKQGEQVFAAIQTYATREDEQELRKYCSRIDDEEFQSWEQINALNPPFKK